MKKLILFSILSVLFYSAPGYTLSAGEEVKGAAEATAQVGERMVKTVGDIGKDIGNSIEEVFGF